MNERNITKKIYPFVIVCALCMLLISYCNKEKTMHFDEDSWNFTGLRIVSGDNGMTRYLKKEESKEFLKKFYGIEFQKLKKSGESTGYQYAVHIYNGEESIDGFMVLGENIKYQGALYHASNQKIDLDYIHSLFCIESEFDEVNNMEGFTLSTEKEIYPNGIDEIKLLYVNKLETEITYGNEINLEIEEDGIWYKVLPSRELSWKDIAMSLPSNAEAEETLSLEAYNHYISDGHYRLVKTIDIHEKEQTTPFTAAAEFYVSGDLNEESLEESEESISPKKYSDIVYYKPVIYLYPEEECKIEVKLDLDGEFIVTYPDYDTGWNVIAKPDGTLINLKDGLEYSYLFWEGNAKTDYDMSRGFVIKGKDTKDFLQEKLAFLGLTPREYNEFIVYWLPLMQNNPYNLITFQQEEYTDTARLEIVPEPDRLLRVFMVYEPLEEWIEVQEQELQSFERTGFTVVEWGGAIK